MKDLKPPANSKAASGAGKQGGLSAETQSRIGHQLRAMYDDVVRQGVPDRFADPCRRLDSQEAAAQVAAGAGPFTPEAIEATAKKDGRD